MVVIDKAKQYIDALEEEYYDEPRRMDSSMACAIAHTMGELIALAENGQSAIDTNARLQKKIEGLSEENKKLKSMLENSINDIMVALDDNDSCMLCKYYVKCEKEKCKQYMDGKGAYDENGNLIDFNWTCMDFNYGTCPKLEITPCNGCDFINHWKWRGLE